MNVAIKLMKQQCKWLGAYNVTEKYFIIHAATSDYLDSVFTTRVFLFSYLRTPS